MVLDGGYTSPATRERRRKAAAVERVGGVDLNVCNLSVVSLPATLQPADGPVLADQITLTDLERAAVERERRTARRRARALERSRRANNNARYELSRRQRRRQQRRQAAGLPERHVELPKGPRLSDAAGRPLVSLSQGPAHRRLPGAAHPHPRAAGRTHPRPNAPAPGGWRSGSPPPTGCG